MGNLLVVAVLVAPAATARMLTRRMVPMMALAGVFALAAGIGGLYASYYANLAAGAAMALAMVAGYLAVGLAGSLSGLRRRPWRRRPAPAPA
jgi:ABC-type Mn2+/Zn2+ transport system permease subunit